MNEKPKPVVTVQWLRKQIVNDARALAAWARETENREQLEQVHGLLTECRNIPIWEDSNKNLLEFTLPKA